MTSTPAIKCRSPFRWIGGKRRIAAQLLKFIPLDAPMRRYYEPFVGAGSLYFALRPKKVTLCDVNEDLINCYRQLRDRPVLFYRYLRRWSGRFDTRRYIEARATFNRLNPGPHRAALFLVLNRTCFNGIWRVCRRGQFNVPFGGKSDPLFPTLTELRGISDALRRTSLAVGDYESKLGAARCDDFVYLDPPYPPLNGTSFFVHYTAARFPIEQHERLATVMDRLTRRGCRVMVSNAGVRRIYEVFGGYRIETLPTTRYVAAGGIRHRVDDVVILNYSKNGKVQRR